MIKNKKYIIFILVIVCIVAFSFLNKATVFDSIIAVGLSVQIEQEKIFQKLEIKPIKSQKTSNIVGYDGIINLSNLDKKGTVLSDCKFTTRYRLPNKTE